MKQTNKGRRHPLFSPPNKKTTQKKGLFQKGFSLFLALLFILGAASPAAAAQKTPRVVTVAFPQASGINETYEDGTHGGCTYDWLMEIAKYTGWTYEFITEGDTSEQINLLRAGECDLMGGMYYRDTFEELYNYPKYSMGSNYSLLIYRQDEPNIKSYDYTTMDGKKIGVFTRATEKIARLQEFLLFNNVSCELVYYDDSEAYKNCLENNEVDLMLGTDIYMKEHYNVAAMIPAEAYYLVTAKDEPELCRELSHAMESIYEADPTFATELYNKYFPDKYINSITFTEAELSFIKKSKPLRVAVLQNRYPLHYEQNRKIKGIIPETLELITKRTGLQFEYVYADNYQGLLDLIKNGQADLIGCYMDDAAAAAANNLVLTADFATLDSVILRNKNSLRVEDHMAMALPRGRIMDADNPNDTVHYYTNYQDCLDAVNDNEKDEDYTRIPASFISEYYAMDYYPNLVLVTDTNLQDEISLALPQPIDVTLYSILSKALNNLSDEELLHISTQNMVSLPKSSATLKSLFYSNPTMTVGVTVGIILIIAIAIILLIFYRMRANMMRIRLEKAEETSRAKSDFLSRMSHEIRTPMNAIIGITNLSRMSQDLTEDMSKNLSKIDSSAQYLLSILNDVLDMSKLESERMQIEDAPFDLAQLIGEVESMFSAQAATRQLEFSAETHLQHTLYIGDKMRLQQILANLVSNACKFTDPQGKILLSVKEQHCMPHAAQLYFSVKDNGIGISPEDIGRIFDSFEQVKNSNQRAPGTGLGLAISSKLVHLMGGELRVESVLGNGSEFHFTITLPLYEGVLNDQAPEELFINEDQLNGLRVLLAEDNDLNAEIAIELMKLKGIEIHRASDGAKAVALFQKSAEGFFDIILMDLNMPVKDGLTASREIRSLQRSDAATVPIVAMTANTFQEDQDMATESGMNGFLPKPFDVQQLYQILVELRQK